MLDFLNQTFAVNACTIAVAALLAGWSGMLTMRVPSKTVPALMFVAGFIFGALVANPLFAEYAFPPTPDKDTNLVVTCTLGNIAALPVLLLATRITAAIAGVRAQRHPFQRL